MGYFRDLHMNPDGSCITCNTQQLAYQDYKGCLCSIIDDVGADVMNRIIKLIEPLGCPENGVSHDCQNGLGYTTAQDLIALIKGEK